MKAFISYSFNEQEQYIATLLSYRLREHGFSLIESNMYDDVDETTKYQIFLAQLFVGIISSNGQQWLRVMEEYNLAANNNTPAILLVENNVPVADDFVGRIVIFNRNNPQQAVDEIRGKMQAQSPANNNALGWVLGGAALIAMLALLSNGNSKK